MFADTVLFWFHFECFVSVFFIVKSQTAGTEEQFPATAGTQAPRLLEVLGRCRCNSQSGPSHRQLRRSTQQREDVLRIQAQLAPQVVCLLNVPAWTLLEQPSLWSACMHGSTPATLSPSSFQIPPSPTVPLLAPGPPLQALFALLWHCVWGPPPLSPTTQHHVSKQLTQAWRVRSGEWMRGEGKTEGIFIKSGPGVGQEV